jgi:putative transposase
MPGPRPVPIVVTDAQCRSLQNLVNTKKEEYALVNRAWIILLAHNGHGTREIARYLHLSEDCVCHWKQRWRECATTGLGETQVRVWLSDAPRPGAPPTFTAEQWCQIIALACEDPQQSGRPISHWTTREVADEAILRQIVPTISERHLGQFFKRSRSQTASNSLLADPALRSLAGGANPGSLPDL